MIAAGGSGVVISNQAGHVLPPLTVDQHQALARTGANDLAQLPFLQFEVMPNSRTAYAITNCANPPHH